MDHAQLAETAQLVSTYNRDHDLGATMLDGGAIATWIGSVRGRVYALRAEADIGALIHLRLSEIGWHTQTIADDRTGGWYFLVRLDLHRETFLDHHRRLRSEPQSPISLSAPGNLLILPSPCNRGSRCWKELPAGTGRLRMSAVLNIAEQMIPR
ncbi:MAG: hypothetical protein J2P18_07185 [Nocardia sp.]|nr:hypothetical protein [Nocardia sp.]